MTQSQVWRAIEGLARSSHSETSKQQRTLARIYRERRASGLIMPETLSDLKSPSLIDSETGRLISKIF